MNLFQNQNHRVNGRSIEKVASVYDTLAVSNREQTKPLNVTSFSSRDNQQLREHIQKTASVLDDHPFLKTASTIDKEAFLSGGMDIFAKTKGLLANKLGVGEAEAHDLASPLITQTYKIQEKYGGDENNILTRLVDEMQNQMVGTSPTGHVPGQAQDTMRNGSSASLEEEVKHALIQQLGLTAYEADHVKKTIVSEARDMTTMLRPHSTQEIANAIVSVVVHHHDPNVAFNIKGSSIYLSEIKGMLG